MAITTADGLLAAMPGQQATILKPMAAMQANGQWFSTWQTAGIPGAGTTPSAGVAGATLVDSDAGGMPFTNPASGMTYLDRLILVSGTQGTAYLYDRLWHNSGLSTTLLTAQTVNSVALPSRCPVLSDPTGETFDTNGNGVEAWFHVYAVMGAGSTAPTISYTDEAGNAGSTGTLQNFVTTAAVGRTFPFSLAAGDRGVRSIQSYTNGATMTSGTFGLVLRRRLASCAIAGANIPTLIDWAASGLPAIPNDTHLELLWVPATATATTLQGDLSLIQG